MIARYTTFAINDQPPQVVPTPTPPAKLIPVTVAASRAGYGNVLHVDLNPNRGTAGYTVRVQKLNAGRTWTTLPGSYRTEGSTETRSITLPKGTYRAYVPAAAGYAAAVSKAITLTDPTVKALLGPTAPRAS